MTMLGNIARQRVASAAVMLAVASIAFAAQARQVPDTHALVGAWDAQAVDEKGQVIPLRLDFQLGSTATWRARSSPIASRCRAR